MHSDIDNFLKQHKNDGTMESEGSFSVDRVAALRKTLSSAFPEPHYYVFQILQSLVRSKASDIRVAIGRNDNRISFEDSSHTFSDFDDLMNRCQKGLSVSSNDPCDLLVSGLTTATGSHMLSAELQLGHKKLTFSAAGVTQSELASEVETPLIVLRRVLEHGLSFSWSKIWGSRQEELRIRKAFEHSPVPLMIAGLPTAPHSAWRRSAEGDALCVLVEAAFLCPQSMANHVGETSSNFQKLPHSSLYQGAAQDETSKDTELAVAANLFMMALDENGTPLLDELDKKNWNSRRWTVSLTCEREAQTEILFIRNGYSIERRTCDLALPGARIVAPADDLLVDASGYRLVRNETYLARIKEAKEKAHIVMSLMKEQNLSTLLQQTGRDADTVLAKFPWLN